MRAIAVQRLDDAAQVHAVGLDAKNTHAAHAVQRLQDDVLVLGMKALDVLGVARDQRRADELRKLHDGKFFRVVAQRTRPVENARAFALGLLQQMRAVEILAVKGRVFAHDDCAKVFECLRPFVGLLLPGSEPVGCVAGQLDVAHKGGDRRAALPHDVFGLAGADAVAAPLGLTHHDKGGVLVNLEGLERVSNEENVHRAILAGRRPRPQISIFEPSSTTELLGSFRKSAAPLALWCIWANSFSRQVAMPPPMVGITVSRDKK